MESCAINYMGISIGFGEFINNDELCETYIEVNFSDDSMKEFNGNCLVINHSQQSIVVWDNKGKKLFESPIIDIPFFRRELLRKIADSN
ncbi:hypothetical protein EMIT07CA2_550084 [Brevibacillus sp. IT-7CA2]|uniref:hypothetical protein n=1 Tax=Brevibacillus sp. IT-7CA2 TaxID=3026436 RepID=UPI0039E0A538